MENMNSFGDRKISQKEVLSDFVKSIKLAGFTDIVLKGGMNLEAALVHYGSDLPFRRTVDIDVHITQLQLWEDFISSVDGKISQASPMSVKYKVVGRRGIHKTRFSDSVKIESSTGDQFSVDMNLNGSKLPTEVFREDYPEGFSIGVMLADKIKVFYSKKIYRRSKDLYDLFLLSHLEDYKFSGINEDLIRKWESSGFPEIPIEMPDIDQLYQAYSKLRGLEHEEDFRLVFKRVMDFTFPFLDWDHLIEAKWNRKGGFWRYEY